MGKTRFLVVLAVAFMILLFSCKKSEKPESMEIPAEAVHVETQGEAAAPAAPLLFRLDGKADDWAGTVPFWEEAVPAGAGLAADNIDIKQVYFKNDGRYLYVFMRILPTIEERFKKSPSGGIIGDIFLDTDNNVKTGSNAAEGYESDLYKGYEVRIHIPVGVMSSSEGSTPLVGYEVYTHEGGFYGINYAARQDSTDEGALIAHGPDGVEFALSLEAMKLAAPATFRVMLNQFATLAGQEGCSVGQLTLEAPK